MNLDKNSRLENIFNKIDETILEYHNSKVDLFIEPNAQIIRVHKTACTATDIFYPEIYVPNKNVIGDDLIEELSRFEPDPLFQYIKCIMKEKEKGDRTNRL
ncbi:MAG: hypothetical protein IPJ75_03815 [Ignavibacteriales bacterium]|nr:hypothetical protein [Ignavibacteriales bacterium]